MSDDEMKTIDDKVIDLENEREKLANEKKELVSKAEILKREYEETEKSFLKWNGKLNTLLKTFGRPGDFDEYAVLILFLSYFFIVPIIVLLFYSPTDIMGVSTRLFIALFVPLLLCASAMVFYSFLFGSWVGKVKNLRVELNERSTEIANIEQEIKRFEMEISKCAKEIFALEQHKKGLVSFVDRFGVEKWGTPEQVKRWSEKDFEARQKANGLIKYKGKWMTPQEKFEEEQKERGLIKFVDRLSRVRWGTPQQVREWKIMDMDMRNGFRRLEPREFEELIGELFVKMGYEASLTRYTADFGADIVAKKGADTIVVQVKKYSRDNRVGSPEVQRLLGSMFKYKANKAIFITTSDFTDDAREQARGAPIELWNFSVLNKKIEHYLLNLKNNNF